MKVRFLLACCATFLVLTRLGAQVVLFSENFGTPSANTSVTSYTGFQNQGTLTFSGTADVRNSTTSSGYTGASGGGNLFLSSSGNPTFTISGIDTSGYQAGTLNLSFGAQKGAIDSNMTELLVQYSTDGVNYTTLAIPAQPTGSGTTNWRSITLSATSIPSSSSLSLRWSNSGTASSFRLDDITLAGTAIPEPSTYAAIAGLAALGLTAWRRRQRNRK